MQPLLETSPDLPTTPRLLQLPPELLQLIWEALPSQPSRDILPFLEGRLGSRHSLRCSCRDAKEIVTRFIHGLCIEVGPGLDLQEAYSDEEREEGAWAAAAKEALAVLAAFPSAASLTKLSWKYMQYWHDGEYNWVDEDDGLVYTEFQPAEETAPCISLPALLPAFIFGAGSRLAALSSLELSGQAVLSSGDVSCIVDACPHLQNLTLDQIAVVGPVFRPLARLASLRELSVKDVRVPHGTDFVGASLANLASISKLSIVRLYQCFIPEKLCLEDVLPHLKGLDALRDLELDVLARDPDHEGGSFQHLSSLAQLTSLALRQLGRQRCEGLSAELSSLALMSRLASLTLLQFTLETEAIRVLAALPMLTELHADALDLECSCRGISCSWRHLTVHNCVSLQELLWLPLGSITELCIYSHIKWELSAGQHDLEAIVARVHEGASILAQGWTESLSFLELHWAPAGEVGESEGESGEGERGEVPPGLSCPRESARVLAALAPLHGQRLCLKLSRSWDLGPQHVEQLSVVLPSLWSLHVTAASGACFLQFVAAVGRGLPALKEFIVTSDYNRQDEGDEAHDAVRLALLAMAVSRASEALPLCLRVRIMTSAQCDDFNKEVEAHRQGIAKGGVAFTRY